MASHPREVAVDTVIVGNGPSALILSYILHGHIPYYIGGLQDHRLHEKLKQSPDLTHLTANVYNHFSSNHSSQALPVNALLDGLIRPNGDTDVVSKSCVEWRKEPARAVSHLVLGNAPHPGGQWVDNPIKASWDIGTLSYAEQLNLPGYSMAEYWQRTKREPLADMIRPTRNDVTDYLKAYPAAVEIDKAIRTSTTVSNVSRRGRGFYVEPFGIFCMHVVLATGIFNINLPPPRFLDPLTSLSLQERGPVLVIGSGFTAADIIISTPPGRKIIHLFNWDPTNRPSPLKACHGSAYPEYAWIYRQMKLAVDRSRNSDSRKGSMSGTSTRTPPKSSTLYFSQRDWSGTYEGYPNSRITSLSLDDGDEETVDGHNVDPHHPTSSSDHSQRSATIHIGRSSSGSAVTRTVTSFQYATGRRGSLSYLSAPLLQETLVADPPNLHNGEINKLSPLSSGPERDFAHVEPASSSLISRLALREKIESAMYAGEGDAAGLELAPGVFVIGSLTGDSLIRFAYGGCAAVAGAISNRQTEAVAHPQHLQLDRKKD